MKYLSLPNAKTRILPFYLAMEEYAARIIGDDDIFFMWQVGPTVIFGRNQLIDCEVNVEYCRAHGVEFYRRRSGGGCVYADWGNIMMSYITRSDDVQMTFARYTGAVAAMLRDMGLNASDNSRNDVLIDGLKVSGNAFYHLPGRSIVHGTMLWDTDMENMLHAITPSSEKLSSKGVQSVRSHIAMLKDYLEDMDIETFKRHVRTTLCDGEIVLNDSDVEEIERLTLPYLEPEFLLGNNPRCEVVKAARIPGVGDVRVSLELKHNVIRDLHLAGDYFALADAQRELIARLQGTRLDRDVLEAALADAHVEHWIMNLTNKQLITLLTN